MGDAVQTSIDDSGRRSDQEAGAMWQAMLGSMLKRLSWRSIAPWSAVLVHATGGTWCVYGDD
eukprot:1771376-Prorocentrum_lima.AAC.1